MMPSEQRGSQVETRTLGGVQISISSLEAAGLVQLHIEGGPIALAVLLSAGEAIELGQRVHDAANVIEMANG